MSWASRRRAIIAFIIIAIAAAFFAVLSFAVFYKTPSCHDGIQNQGEQGVDCGGPCPYLCASQVEKPNVLYTRTLPASYAGYTDIIASVENLNPAAAAKNVSYTVTLYGKNQTVLQKTSGIFDLPPAATVPIFIPSVSTGGSSVASAFLSVATSTLHWYSMPHDTRVVPTVSNTTLGGATSTPRVQAVLTNPTTQLLSNVPVVVIVHDAANNVIAASKTLVASIPSQGEATATFTWNRPFPQPPAAIEVVPIVPLP